MASNHASTEPTSTATSGVRRLAAYGFAAVVAASLANVVILIVALAAATFPSEFVGGPFGPLAIGPVVMNSAVAAVAATVVYGTLVRYSSRPNRTFVIASIFALAASFGMFLAPDLAGAPLRLLGVLAVMHVTAAVTIVTVLLRAGAAR